jgi:hypothetical protein
MHGNGRLVHATVMDSSGHAWNLHGIRIFDGGYGIIDVYVDLNLAEVYADDYDDMALSG